MSVVAFGSNSFPSLLNFDLSSNNCFLCLGRLQPTKEADFGGSKLRLKNISKYLNLDLSDVLAANLNDAVSEDSDVQVSLCQDCTKVVEKFHQLYRVWESTKLRMDECVRIIRDIISQSFSNQRNNDEEDRMIDVVGDGDSDDSSDDGQTHSTLMEHLRTFLMDKCSSKIQLAPGVATPFSLADNDNASLDGDVEFEAPEPEPLEEPESVPEFNEGALPNGQEESGPDVEGSLPNNQEESNHEEGEDVDSQQAQSLNFITIQSCVSLIPKVELDYPVGVEDPLASPTPSPASLSWVTADPQNEIRDSQGSLSGLEIGEGRESDLPPHSSPPRPFRHQRIAKALLLSALDESKAMKCRKRKRSLSVGSSARKSSIRASINAVNKSKMNLRRKQIPAAAQKLQPEEWKYATGRFRQGLKSRFRVRIRLKDGSVKVRCEVCNVLISPSNLSRHLRTHQKITCDKCGYLSVASKIRRHQRNKLCALRMQMQANIERSTEPVETSPVGNGGKSDDDNEKLEVDAQVNSKESVDLERPISKGLQLKKRNSAPKITTRKEALEGSSKEKKILKSNRIPCPQCGLMIAKNNMSRHLKRLLCITLRESKRVGAKPSSRYLRSVLERMRNRRLKKKNGTRASTSRVGVKKHIRKRVLLSKENNVDSDESGIGSSTISDPPPPSSAAPTEISEEGTQKSSSLKPTLMSRSGSTGKRVFCLKCDLPVYPPCLRRHRRSMLCRQRVKEKRRNLLKETKTPKVVLTRVNPPVVALTTRTTSAEQNQNSQLSSGFPPPPPVNPEAERPRGLPQRDRACKRLPDYFGIPCDVCGDKFQPEYMSRHKKLSKCDQKIGKKFQSSSHNNPTLETEGGGSEESFPEITPSPKDTDVQENLNLNQTATTSKKKVAAGPKELPPKHMSRRQKQSKCGKKIEEKLQSPNNSILEAGSEGSCPEITPPPISKDSDVYKNSNLNQPTSTSKKKSADLTELRPKYNGIYQKLSEFARKLMEGSSKTNKSSMEIEGSGSEVERSSSEATTSIQKATTLNKNHSKMNQTTKAPEEEGLKEVPEALLSSPAPPLTAAPPSSTNVCSTVSFFDVIQRRSRRFRPSLLKAGRSPSRKFYPSLSKRGRGRLIKSVVEVEEQPKRMDDRCPQEKPIAEELAKPTPMVEGQSEPAPTSTGHCQIQVKCDKCDLMVNPSNLRRHQRGRFCRQQMRQKIMIRRSSRSSSKLLLRKMKLGGGSGCDSPRKLRTRSSGRLDKDAPLNLQNSAPNQLPKPDFEPKAASKGESANSGTPGSSRDLRPRVIMTNSSRSEPKYKTVTRKSKTLVVTNPCGDDNDDSVPVLVVPKKHSKLTKADRAQEATRNKERRNVGQARKSNRSEDDTPIPKEMTPCFVVLDRLVLLTNANEAVCKVDPTDNK